jgi:hypothetical protein
MCSKCEEMCREPGWLARIVALAQRPLVRASDEERRAVR